MLNIRVDNKTNEMLADWLYEKNQKVHLFRFVEPNLYVNMK